MSKSNLKLQGAVAGLIAAIFLAGCEYVEPVVPQAQTAAPTAFESSIDTPDHP
jgi:hypothetical protein